MTEEQQQTDSPSTAGAQSTPHAQSTPREPNAARTPRAPREQAVSREPSSTRTPSASRGQVAPHGQGTPRTASAPREPGAPHGQGAPHRRNPQSRRRTRSQSEMIPMDGSALARPQRILGPQLLILLALIIVGGIIGYNLYSQAMDNFVYANERQQAAAEQQLSRNVTLDLPKPELFIGYSDAEISANIATLGLITFNNEVSDGTTLEIVKLPSDLTVEQGQTLYAKGISKLTLTEAAQLLNGHWVLDVSPGDETVIKLRYADFKSGSIEAALTNAMQAQGLTEDSVLASGIDDSGNTYKTGTAVINDIVVTWRVSVLKLSDMYSITGLGDTAMYVGIRYTY